MGLFRDTYNITKINTTPIAIQMERKNDIEEKQNKILNETRDRVNVSLKKYEELKKELSLTKSSLSRYEAFVKALAEKIHTNPEILLHSKLVKSESKRRIDIRSNYLYLLFEIEDEQIGEV